jgi:L-alanine-DL-glutamate epimerase-like enolase superfamily enzyme
VKKLPLAIDNVQYKRAKSEVSSGFTRVTTTVRLQGKDDEGVGEDVIYESDYHDFYGNEAAELKLNGEFNLESFFDLLDRLTLFHSQPTQAAYLDYRRWAFESAALDLALRQSDTTLHLLLDRKVRPVNFVVSLNMSDNPDISDIHHILEHYPRTRLKLDAGKGWDSNFVAGLAKLGIVDCIDFKGQYKGTIVDQEADVILYQLIAGAFSSSWMEDPGLSPETEEFMNKYRDRISWDAPIHSVGDIVRLPLKPGAVNIKPSRFGTIQRLFEAYEYCQANDILMYGGGQFELGAGRKQIQYLASLFHPDGPNDVAPIEYNQETIVNGLPESPLHVKNRKNGFA